MMLEIENLHVHYGKIHALKGLSLRVNAGEIVSLIGSNGAGKSSLIHSVFKQPRPTHGKITFMRHDINGIAPHKIAGLGIAIVPEGRRIFPKLTVKENLDLGSTALNGKQSSKGLEEVLALFPVLAGRMGQNGGTLSGGEQQMLAIARALMSRPKLLIMDEPSLGLAPIIIKQIFKTIATLNQNGMTILLVEQNANQALRLAHRAYVLVSGEVVMEGTGSDLLSDPVIRAAYLAG